MKAIIIAAGKGTRIERLNSDLPKCMLEVGAKTILERQVHALNSNGITDISVIKGYRKEKIGYPGLKFYINDEYESNNILNSLFYAEDEMNDDVIISYSDILYGNEIVRRLGESKKEITIVVDTKWEEYYKGRSDHPTEEAEKVVLDAEDKVLEIGKAIKKNDNVSGEFIGMMKLTKTGTDIFKRYFRRVKKLFWGKPFVKAPAFEKAYLTDMLQYLVDNGVEINSVIIEKGWYEIDTVEDYEKVKKTFNLYDNRD